jgi:serine/threonine-protein kinase
MALSDHPDTPPAHVANAPTADVMRRCRHCAAALSPTSSFCSKCGGSTPLTDDPADPLRDQTQALFGADLVIERELGRGGMAAVYAAFDPTLQRRVAVKVLLPEVADDRDAADRFLREARTVAALQHPHVVTVYAVRSGNGVNAMVMQFVEGRSLDVVLQDRGRLSVSMAGLLLAQAANGLQHAHERGVVHRDIKPANILIDHDGHAIVSDFGIARREDSPRITGTGLVIGTWAYMSPEQRTAESVTAATDQYALGVMAFELLTGKLPFTGSPTDMLHAHLSAPVPSLRALRPEVPEQAEEVVRRMLAKAPGDRWPSLRDVERAFRKLVDNESHTTQLIAALTAPIAQPGSSTMVSAVRVPHMHSGKTEQLPQRPPPAPAVAPAIAPAVAPAVATPVRARRIWIPVAAIVLALASLGVWAVQSRQPSPGSAASTPQAGAPAMAPVPLAPAGTASENAAASSQPTRPSATSQPNANAAPSVQLTITPSVVAAAPAAAPSAPEAKAAEPARTEPTAAPAKAFPPSSVNDARRLGREFVTLLNQRRFREIAQWPAVGGSPALRAELLKLTESATDLSAGFDRIPSAPDEWTNGFQTEFFLDLEWRDGRKTLRIRLFATPGDAGWRTVGFAVDEP